jgi:hypothetical protein
MNVDDELIIVDGLSKLFEDSQKLRTLKHQYGIASRKIHDLKAENALLRERLREYEAQPQPITFPLDERIPRVYSEPEHEQAAMGLTLRSARPHYRSDKTFLIKYTVAPNATEYLLSQRRRWWSLDEDGEPDAWGLWQYWQEKYGPFTEVFDVAD